MKLEYAGLKPVISEHGISFKDGKEDKFIYLSIAVDILNAINHNYEQKKKYSHQVSEVQLKADEILNILLKFHPDLEDTMNQEVDSYTKHLDAEEEDVRNRINLSQIEKDTFIANLKLMRKYKTQRAKNKIFYFHCIETIIEIILKYKIKEIDTPFNERFWHILQTIEGKLSAQKVSSNLKTIEENCTLKAMLLINIY